MKKDKLEKYWVDITKIVANGIDAATGNSAAGIVAKALAASNEASREDGVSKNLPVILGVPLAPNPRFVENGHGSGQFAHTAAYIRKRVAKKIGGEVFEISGTITSAATGGLGVNMAALAKHGSADISSVAHLHRFLDMSRRIKGSQFLTSLLSVLIHMKASKIAIRSGDVIALERAACLGKYLAQRCVCAKLAAKKQLARWLVLLRRSCIGGPF